MIKESIIEVVELPEGVQAEIAGKKVSVSKNGNENTRAFKSRGISFKKTEKGIEVEAVPATRKMNALLKTIEGHIKNMVRGLDNDFEYKMVIVFSHFPMSVNVKGDKLEVTNFAGEKKPRFAKILPGVKVEVKGKDVFVKGHNREATGQTAANIEQATKVRGKDRRVFQDGIFIEKKPEKQVRVKESE